MDLKQLSRVTCVSELRQQRDVLLAWLDWVNESLGLGSAAGATASCLANGGRSGPQPPFDPATLACLRRVILESLGELTTQELSPSARRN